MKRSRTISYNSSERKSRKLSEDSDDTDTDEMHDNGAQDSLQPIPSWFPETVDACSHISGVSLFDSTHAALVENGEVNWYDLKVGKCLSSVGRHQNTEEPWTCGVDARGRLFVSDITGRVHIFDKDATYIRSIGENVLINPAGVSVDKARGHVYVSDLARKSVDCFAEDGRRLLSISPAHTDWPLYISYSSTHGLLVSDVGQRSVNVITASALEGAANDLSVSSHCLVDNVDSRDVKIDESQNVLLFCESSRQMVLESPMVTDSAGCVSLKGLTPRVPVANAQCLDLNIEILAVGEWRGSLRVIRC